MCNRRKKSNERNNIIKSLIPFERKFQGRSNSISNSKKIIKNWKSEFPDISPISRDNYDPKMLSKFWNLLTETESSNRKWDAKINDIKSEYEGLF